MISLWSDGPRREIYLKLGQLVIQLMSEDGHIREWTGLPLKFAAFPLFSNWYRKFYFQLFFEMRRISIGITVRETDEPGGLR